MKSKVIYMSIVFFFIGYLIINYKMKPYTTNEEVAVSVNNVEKKKSSNIVFKPVNNVSIVINDPYHKTIGNNSVKNYIINVKKSSFYVKYKINSTDKNISRNSMHDSILLLKKENKHALNFFLKENNHLNETYWDSISEGRVRKIYFLNDDVAVVKNINIIGDPLNIDYLKESCDYLLEKVREYDKKRQKN